MRVRLRYAKTGKVRWTSHRDVARMWERAFRRVQLSLAYTQGFSPRPKVAFGLALPTGAESVAEYLDIELDPERSDGVAVPTLPERLTPALPLGLDVTAAAVIDDRTDSLQESVTSSCWTIEVVGAPEGALHELVAAALAADTLVITRERKGRTSAEDVRPAIVSVHPAGPGERGHLLACELATQPRGLRPAELVRALSPGLEEGRVRRTAQWMSRDGAEREDPLPLATTDAPLAPLEERAS